MSALLRVLDLGRIAVPVEVVGCFALGVLRLTAVVAQRRPHRLERLLGARIHVGQLLVRRLVHLLGDLLDVDHLRRANVGLTRGDFAAIPVTACEATVAQDTVTSV